MLELPDGGVTSVDVEDADVLGAEPVLTARDGTSTLSIEGARRLLGLLVACMERCASLAEGHQRHVQRANERLWSGWHPDTPGVYDDAAVCAGVGAGRMMGTLARGDDASAPLAALQQIHWAIHGAFVDYQRLCEERRQLAFDVGDLAARLTGAGWAEEAARSADVHELARTMDR